MRARRMVDAVAPQRRGPPLQIEAATGQPRPSRAAPPLVIEGQRRLAASGFGDHAVNRRRQITLRVAE